MKTSRTLGGHVQPAQELSSQCDKFTFFSLGSGLVFSKFAEGILWIIYVIFVLVPVHGIPPVYRSIIDIFELDAYTLNKGQMRVPIFYALHTNELEFRLYKVATCVNAVALGAIHCVGWLLF